MTTSEIKQLNDKEIEERISMERAMFTKLKLQHSVSSIENPTRIKTTKKLIASLLTEQSVRRNKKEVTL